MIVLLVTLTESDSLLNLLKQRGYGELATQLERQMTMERMLPTNELPCFVYRFEDVANGSEIYDPKLARAMYDGMMQGMRTCAYGEQAVSKPKRRKKVQAA